MVKYFLGVYHPAASAKWYGLTGLSDETAKGLAEKLRERFEEDVYVGRTEDDEHYFQLYYRDNQWVWDEPCTDLIICGLDF